MSERKSYPSDTTDSQWAILAPLIATLNSDDRLPDIAMRDVLDAILYVLKGGGSWNLLPPDFPPKGAVYHYFRIWRNDGTWQRIMEVLGE